MPYDDRPGLPGQVARAVAAAVVDAHDAGERIDDVLHDVADDRRLVEQRDHDPRVRHA
jgi:hypothetical protein